MFYLRDYVCLRVVVSNAYCVVFLFWFSSSCGGMGGSMSQVVGLPNNSYNHITNTAWVRARLCKLQNRVHSTRSRKSYLPMVGGSLWLFQVPPPLKLVAMDIAEILLKVALNTTIKQTNNKNEQAQSKCVRHSKNRRHFFYLFIFFVLFC